MLRRFQRGGHISGVWGNHTSRFEDPEPRGTVNKGYDTSGTFHQTRAPRGLASSRVDFSPLLVPVNVQETTFHHLGMPPNSPIEVDQAILSAEEREDAIRNAAALLNKDLI